MKRIIALILTGIMLVTIAACTSGDAGTKEPKTVGEALLQDFQSNAGEMDAQEMANTLLANDWIKFSGVSAPVEEGLLMGFGNTEVVGFENGVMFGPMIGTIPFVGYVFELEEGADEDAFVKNLEANADLAWNICTEAEEMVSGSAENMVFFVMSPKAFEE